MYQSSSPKIDLNKSSNATLITPTIDKKTTHHHIKNKLTRKSMNLSGHVETGVNIEDNDPVPDEITQEIKPSCQQNDTDSVVFSSIMAGSEPNSHSTLNVNQFKSPVYFKNNKAHIAKIANPEAQEYLQNPSHKVQENDEGFFSACRRPLRVGNKDYKTLNKEIRESAKWSENKEANASKASAEEKIALARSFLVKELIINTFKEDNKNVPLTLAELEKFNKIYKEIIDKIVNDAADNNEINQLYNKLDKRKVPSRSNFIQLIKDCDTYAKFYSQGEAKVLSAIIENSLDKMNCCTNHCELVLGIENTGSVFDKYNITMTNTMKDMVLQTDGISLENSDDWDGGKKIDIHGSKIAIKSTIKKGNIERQGIIAYDSFSCDMVAGKNKFSSNSLAPYIQENSHLYVSTSDPKYFRKSAFSRLFTTRDGWEGGISGMILAGIITGGLTYFGIIGTAISAIAFPPLAVAIVGGIIIAAGSYFLGKWLLPKPTNWLLGKIKCCIPCCGKNDDIDEKITPMKSNNTAYNDQHSRPTIINNKKNGFNKPEVENNYGTTGTNSFHHQNETTIAPNSDVPTTEHQREHSNSLSNQT